LKGYNIFKNICELDLGDIENELNSTLDRYQKKQDQIRESERRELKDHIILENEFKGLFNTVVELLMISMVKYFESRGSEFRGSYVKLSHLAKITLVINPYRIQQGSESAEIEFSRKGNKLKIKKTKNKSSQEALFEKSDINPRFVKRILIDFVKSYYTEGPVQVNNK
jgi:hypothetical protein